ncbi:DUF6890 family protein [Vibrio mangrovi]|uniref:DUF6890 family protein n=1 Tax=Vibrio mangrovi TaxID=474394 RepID=UPI000B3BB05E
MKRIETNGLEQALTLRRHYFPDGEDEPQDLARALWLDQHEKERMEIAVMSAVARLFNHR